MEVLFFLIALVSSMIGVISGIGGGAIIKPVMDSFGALNVSTVSFLSGCTVLCMSLYSLLRNSKMKVEYKTSGWLAMGGILGGILGKIIFQLIKNIYKEMSIGFLQSIILFAINILVAVYIFRKEKIKTYNTVNIFACIVIGCTLGILSSFLGIGGGPLNIAVLHFFFSMNTKERVTNSLFVILCSQASNLLSALITHTVPLFNFRILLVMCIGAVVGAVLGGSIFRRMQEKTTDLFFKILLCFLLVLNVYNILLFSG